MKIFVQITSYRDPELTPTIIDCIRKANNPNNLTFGICWQHDEEENLKEFTINPKFRIIDKHWTESKGTGWAKSLVQNLYEGEDFTLEIDSHHRFEKGWDVELIKMLEGIDADKAILSSSAGGYRASNGEKLNLEPYKMSVVGFDENELPVLRPDYMPNDLKDPIKARFACGHFLFTKGSFCTDYKHDPEIYFEGNDASLSARCFTMGYSLFHPNKNLIWHEYTRELRKKHWLDHTQELKEKGQIEFTWWERDEISKKRVKQLLGIEDSKTSLGEFGLGSNKTLRDYEIYVGVDFSQKLIHPNTTKGESPFEGVINEDDWKKEMLGANKVEEELNEYSLEISWSKEEIEYADDYSFWFFGFQDGEGKEIYRKDFKEDVDKDILTFSKTSKEVTFKSKNPPASCVIWPHSKSRGWLSRVETKLA